MEEKNIQQTYYKPYVAEKKLYKPVEKKDIIFMLLFFVVSFLGVCLGLWGDMHLGLTISYFALFGVTTAYCFKKANGFAIACGILSLAGSTVFTLFNDLYINPIMFILIVGLYTVYTLGISDTFNFKQGSFKMLFDLFLGVSIRPFDGLGDVFGGVKEYAKAQKKSLGGIVGVLVAIPFLAVIIPLLVSSDAAFEGLVSGVIKNVGIVILQLIIALVITPYFFSFAYEKRMKLNKREGKLNIKTRVVSASACTSFLSMISVVYVVYLFSQLAYFFSAFKGILPADYKYTASAFARRGFFEMFAICVINVLIVSLVSMLSKKKSTIIKLLSTFISLFSVLMIAIALQKMKLNVSIYGLSKNRVMVTVFMVMILVAIAFFILHIFVPKISYMQPIIIVCSVIFMALAFSNVDAKIAEYNINAYESGQIENLDIDALANMSDSSIPYVVELMNSKDDEVAKKAARTVVELYNYTYTDDEKNDLRSFNLAHKKAVLYVKDTPHKLLDNILEITKKADWYEYNEERDSYLQYDGKGFYKEYKFDKEQGIYVTDGAQHGINDDYLID